jgi:4-amino-4-deoxy-L-arabinose transferase-like glycosyltransferase
MMIFSLIGMGMISTLVFMLARLVGSAPRALIAALVWMSYPFGLWLTKQPNSEIPFLVCLYAGLYVIGRGVLTQPQRQTSFFVAGILFGLAMLIRPVAIGIGLLAGLAILLVNRAQPIRWRVTALLVLLCGNLILLFPWQVWLYSQTSETMFTSSYGIASIRDGLTFAVDPKNYRQTLDLPADVVALMQDASAARDQLRSMSDIALFLGQQVQLRPQAVIELGIIKAARSWYGTDSQRFEQLILFIQSIYLMLAVSGVGLTWRNDPAARPLLILFGLVVLYFWGMAILVLPILRIMVPAMGLLFVFLPAILPVFKKVVA